MEKQQLHDFLAEEGYEKIPSNLPEFTFYFHMENHYVNVIHVIYYEKNLYITEDQYEHIKDKIKDFFAGKNKYDIHIMSLIICQDMGKAKQLCKNDPFCWMIDPMSDRLVVYENQVSDFYGMRNKIERFLSHMPSLEGEARSGGQSPSGEAVGQKKRNSRFRVPYVTTFLVCSNILIFLICTLTGDLLYNKGAFSAGAFWEGKEYYRILTSIFLHWDINHLAGNMIALYCLGERVEKYFGCVKYGLIYISAGMLGNLLSAGYEVYRDMHISSAGASGAVFGIIGALFVLVCIHKGHLEQITLSQLLLMLIYSIYSGFVESGINHAAHIGGFISGAAISFLLWIPGKKKRAEMGK